MADKKKKDKKGMQTVDALGRRVWDKEEAAERRQHRIEEEDDEATGNYYKDVPLPASQRGYLQRRDVALKLENNIGKFKIVTENTAKSERGGYWCNVCECMLKDSQNYLDHINGRRHNRFLGMTMRVQDFTVDDVKARIAALGNKKRSLGSAGRRAEGGENAAEGNAAVMGATSAASASAPAPEATTVNAGDDIESRLAALEERERMRQERKKEKKKRKAEAFANATSHVDDSEALRIYEEMRQADGDVPARSPPRAEAQVPARAQAQVSSVASAGEKPAKKAKKAKPNVTAADEEDDADVVNPHADMMAAMGLPVGFT